MKSPRALYLRTLYGNGLIGVGLLVLASQGACSREICAGVEGGCLALRVEGNDNKEPIYVDVLDAFGQRLVRRQSDPSPRPLIEVVVPRPEAAQCLRVFVGSGAARKTAVVRVDGLSAGGRIDRTIQLSRPPDDAMFTAMSQGLAGRGSGVAIGRVPGFKSPLLIVGSVPAAGNPRVQFFPLASGTAPPDLEVGAPPYPIVLAGSTDAEARLAVGPSPLETIDGPVVVFRPTESGSGFAPGGQMLALGTNQRATSLAAADLNADQKIDLVVNWNNSTLQTSGSSVFWSLSPPAAAVLPQKSEYLLSAIVAADLDADGLPDLVRTLDYEVRAYPNQPSAPGKFETPSTLLISSVDMVPLGLTTGDLNGDERRDVAVTMNAKKTLSLHLADGSAAWTFQSPVSAATGDRPRAAAAADLNGDFLDDVVTANYGTTPIAPTLIYGTEGGSLRVQDLNQVSEQELVDVATGDLNGDCLPDVALVAKASKSVTLLLNKSVPVQ